MRGTLDLGSFLIRILLSRVLYSGPLFSETPKYHVLSRNRVFGFRRVQGFGLWVELFRVQCLGQVLQSRVLGEGPCKGCFRVAICQRQDP